MKRRSKSALGVLLALVLIAAAHAQTGHPAKGSWLGYWGPDDSNQHRIRLLLDWQNREITGVINPGRNQVPIEKAELDVSDWTLTIQAEMPTGNGSTEHYVVTGQLKNLGSWSNRVYEGTYTLGNEHGSFKATRN